MKEHRIIAKEIEQYVFSLNDHGMEFDINITVIIDDKKALLIDVGYIDQALAVRELLEKRGIVVTKVVFTHYHPDHTAGISVFKESMVYCGKDYEINYNNCSQIWDTETAYKAADEIVYSGDNLKFGKHKLYFFDTPGHSVCSISIY